MHCFADNWELIADVIELVSIQSVQDEFFGIIFSDKKCPIVVLFVLRVVNDLLSRQLQQDVLILEPFVLKHIESYEPKMSVFQDHHYRKVAFLILLSVDLLDFTVIDEVINPFFHHHVEE